MTNNAKYKGPQAVAEANFIDFSNISIADGAMSYRIPARPVA